MAPKKAAKDEKPKKPEMSAEMKDLKEREKALVKVSPPDRAKLDTALEGIEAVINGIRTKLQKVNAKIQEKNTGKDEHMKQKDEIKKKLDEYSAKIDELMGQKNAIHGGITAKRQEDRDKRQEQNQMKKKLGFDTPAAVDEKIREIEYQMQTESMNLKKEKELMVQIKELKASRPAVAKYSAMDSAPGSTEDVTAMRGNIDDIKKQLQDVREAKKLTSEAYKRLMDARQKVMGDVPEMFTLREEYNAEIRAKVQERNDARDEFSKEQRTYSEYMKEVRSLRMERAGLERAEWNKERTAWRKEQDDELGEGVPELPFLAELTYLDNMKLYLRGLQPKEDEGEKGGSSEVNVKASAGHTLLLAKGNREEEFFFAPTKKKTLKKKSAGKAKALQHSMQTLKFFDDYKVTPPADVAAIPATLAILEKKVEEFKEKQKKAVENKDKKKKEEGNKEAGDAAPADAEQEEAAQ